MARCGATSDVISTDIIIWTKCYILDYIDRWMCVGSSVTPNEVRLEYGLGVNVFDVMLFIAVYYDEYNAVMMRPYRK